MAAKIVAAAYVRGVDTDVTLYRNSFIGNIMQFNITTKPVRLDYNKTGNQWSDYFPKYPDASEINSSGIGNTPYIIDSNNIDRYPLMGSVPV